MKSYTSFDEIDRDLKFLRLKSKIDLEQVKLDINTSKEIMVETFSPVNLIANLAASIIKKAFFLRVVDKLLGINSDKRRH